MGIVNGRRLKRRVAVRSIVRIQRIVDVVFEIERRFVRLRMLRVLDWNIGGSSDVGDQSRDGLLATTTGSLFVRFAVGGGACRLGKASCAVGRRRPLMGFVFVGAASALLVVAVEGSEDVRDVNAIHVGGGSGRDIRAVVQAGTAFAGR